MLDKNIAIIGGGIFGCMTALKLAKEGFCVTIFERQKTIMTGASKNNQNRLHLGFHYPRDIETAKQCKNGFANFIKEFPESIRTGFPNIYYISSNNSLTTPEQYLHFCDAIGLPYNKIDLSLNEPPVKNVSLGVLCDEVVYDRNILSQLILKRMESCSKISIKYCTEVISIKKNLNDFSLLLNNNDILYCDAVVNCTYGDINRLTNIMGYELSEYQYEYTVVPIVNIQNTIGLTIMDGKFMTFLPYGKSKQSLLYHVDFSVIKRIVCTTMPKSWLDENTNPFTEVDSVAIFENMKAAAINYFPFLSEMELNGFLHGPRMVLSHCENSDARPSIVKNYNSGYMTIFSGKIDHCIMVADEVYKHLVQYFN